MKMIVTSPAFAPGEVMPKRYTGDGEDIAPPIEWTGAPEHTREFALICDDPDAPSREPWVHWVVFNIPGDTTGLPEGKPGKSLPESPAGMREGQTSFGTVGYGGPAPPPGHGLHHYHFKVYALGTPLSLPSGATKADVMHAMRGHILGQGELIATYQR